MKCMLCFVLLLAVVTMNNAFCHTTSARRSTKKKPLNLVKPQNECDHDNDIQQIDSNTGTGTYIPINNGKAEMDIQMALAKHTLLTVAASIMNVPPEVFTTPPPVDPYPPSTPDEMDRRQRITNIFYQGWSPTDGFKTPKDQVDALDSLMKSEETGHLPSTYGEITDLGARQLFDYLGLLANEEADYTFVDLGCGSGKLLVQSYMELPNVNGIIGIELANARYRAAIDAWDRVKTEASEIRHQAGNAKTADMEIYEGDLYELDISSATHIYVASLCFTDDMMRRLAKKMIEEGDQLRCVATLKQFPAEFENNLGGTPSKKYVEMSWTKTRGNGCTVYFYRLNNTKK